MSAPEFRQSVMSQFQKLKGISYLYSLVFCGGKHEGQTYLWVRKNDPEYLRQMYIKNLKAKSMSINVPYPYLNSDAVNFMKEALIERIKNSSECIFKYAEELKEWTK